jgi:hypothetical protein
VRERDREEDEREGGREKASEKPVEDARDGDARVRARDGRCEE